MPLEAAPGHGPVAPVLRHFSHDSHVFPHLIQPGGPVLVGVCPGLMRLPPLLSTCLRVERHLLFSGLDECGPRPGAAPQTATR